MKNIKTYSCRLVCILLALYSTLLYAEDYKIYNLYDGEFSVVFPVKPTVINPMGIDTYTAIVKDKRLIFTASKMPSPLGNNIGGYNKELLDKGLKDSFKPIGNLTSFNSTLDKQKGRYVFIVAYSQSGNETGTSLYTLEKRIITNESMYSWRVTSPTMANKSIFDQYKAYCTLKK
jgi:hypothetical protein